MVRAVTREHAFGYAVFVGDDMQRWSRSRPRPPLAIPPNMIIAQITDLHARPPGVRAYAGIDTNAMMRGAVDAIAALDPLPDCVIATGDLTDCGMPEEYRQVGDAFAQLPIPAFLIPGNHDRRDVMRACLAERHRYLT